MHRHHCHRRQGGFFVALTVPNPPMATAGASSECGDDEATMWRTRNREYSVVNTDIGYHGDDDYYPKTQRTSEFGVQKILPTNGICLHII